MVKNSKGASAREKVQTAGKWLRPLVVAGSLVFALWFFYAVYEQRNGGAETESIGKSAETSKQLRSEVRHWFRKTFPEAAARADERFGLFEYDREGLPVTRPVWVILAHGIDEPGNLWANLAPVLAAEGYHILELRYPNDQPIHESAVLLGREMGLLMQAGSDSPAQGFHLVGHSMGGLVFREFLTHPDLYPGCDWKEAAPVRSMIQLGTPNKGSWLATYRMPIELRDHLFKQNGMDALLGMILDGAGEAQIDLKPESTFLRELNNRPFPESIYWVGVAGTGSPANLDSISNLPVIKNSNFPQSLDDLQKTFPELFKGSGDGAVSVESLRCDEMDEVHHVDANHRNMVRNPWSEMPPAIPIVVEVLARF